jgi:cell division protein FtsB
METSERFLLFVLTLAVCFILGYGLTAYQQDMTEHTSIQEVKDFKQNERIEALEKEIRILKTDIYVLQYGYEGDKDD